MSNIGIAYIFVCTFFIKELEKDIDNNLKYNINNINYTKKYQYINNNLGKFFDKINYNIIHNCIKELEINNNNSYLKLLVDIINNKVDKNNYNYIIDSLKINKNIKNIINNGNYTLNKNEEYTKESINIMNNLESNKLIEIFTQLISENNTYNQILNYLIKYKIELKIITIFSTLIVIAVTYKMYKRKNKFKDTLKYINTLKKENNN